MKLNFKHIIVLGIFFVGSLLSLKQVFAETVATSVIVGNSAPSFTVDAFEVTTSSATSPTNVGTTVTFQATGTDGNGENYYLAICKSDAITPNNNGVPTCTGGNWCISGSTISGNSASCGYGTLQATAETNNWFAFVCDHSPSSVCSEKSINVTDSGTPFEVNHPPSFISIGVTATLDPGTTQTWTTTIGTSDADTTYTDTVKLLVCKTAGVTADACDGGATDTWCTGSAVANSPSCSIGISIPTLDIGYSAYVYVFDNHGLGASGVVQASNAPYTVNNVAPVISNITLNSGSIINLAEGSTQPVVLGATITDNNGCGEFSSLVVSSLHRSGITYENCDAEGNANDNNCYPVLSCSISGNTCDGANDASAGYACTANIKYFADPTVENTTYSAENWVASFTASDEALNDSQTIGSGVEMNDLLAMDIGSSLAYGNLTAGQSLDPLSALTIVTATGNVGLDQTLEGTHMSSVGNTISVENQKYALAALTAYSSGTTLTTTATNVELNCKKTTSDTGETKPTYWGISIPLGTIAGTYGGTNTVIAVKGEYTEW